MKDRISALMRRLNFMNFRVPIGDLEYHIFESPGLWCTDQELEKLTKDMREVAATFHQSNDLPDYGPLTGNREDLAHRLITIAYHRKQKKPIGFSAQIFLTVKYRGFAKRILHLGLIYIDDSVKGQNVSYLLTVFPNLLVTIKNGFRDLYVSSVSQVPAIVGLVGKNYVDVYPTSNFENQRYYHFKLAQLIMHDHRQAFGVGSDAEYDERLQIIKNAYTGGSDELKKTYKNAPKFREESVNKFCENNLNYQRGDDFLQIGKISIQGLWPLYYSKLNRKNFFPITLALMAVALFTLFMPIIRWIWAPIDDCDTEAHQSEELIV
ncbi:MAG: hypothetical protein CME62_13320 [Halobacteriovoraceae bacterium]|nr:hypothetical protein [Halobacteriovoraceae bacterium]|tara:strand:+ start:10121 stop:11086 length:966 start_codon:yes stop_codon:yes gene_type:complete